MSKNPLSGKFRGGLFPKTLGQSVQQVTKPMLKAQGAAESRLLTHWPQIVGPVLARTTQPQKILFPRDKTQGATLVLAVQSGWAPEVQHQEPLILERIAGFFGYRAVEKISIRQAYLDQAQPAAAAETTPTKAPLDAATAAALDEVADPQLRAALTSLGESMQTARTRELSSPKT